MKTYNDLDQYNQCLDDDTLRIIQNANIEIPMARKKSTVVIQNINVKQEQRPLYDLIINEIEKLGSVYAFLDEVYEIAITKNDGNMLRTCRQLGLHKDALYKWRIRRSKGVIPGGQSNLIE